MATELVQHYGFTSAPLPGAEMIVLPIGGRTNHSVVVVATEDGRYRVQVVDGEVCLYTDEGDYIHMKRGRLIEVNTVDLLINAANPGDQHHRLPPERQRQRPYHHRTLRSGRKRLGDHYHPGQPADRPGQRLGRHAGTHGLRRRRGRGHRAPGRSHRRHAPRPDCPGHGPDRPLGFQLDSPITTIKADMWYALDTPLNYQNPKMQQKPTPSPPNPAATKP
ncbi:phage baseplate assembly protein [Pseudomonas aeruginosa]|nr:phage baseplate assembly protein [Pseudomonas aeruginosa]